MLENSYWDIDSILLGMTPKECKLNENLEFLKDLYPGQDNENQFKKDEITKLPLTLSMTLSNPPDGKSYISIQPQYTLSEDYYYDQDNYFGLPEEYYSGDYDSQNYIQPDDNYNYFDDGQDVQSYYDQQEIQEPFKFY